MGYIDQAQSRLNEALSEARRLRHPQTLADVLLAAGPVERIVGSPEMQQHTEELRALATERGLPLNLGWERRTAARGGCRWAGSGRPRVDQGGNHGDTCHGRGHGHPETAHDVAGACVKVGRPADGLDRLTEAAEIIETTDER